MIVEDEIMKGKEVFITKTDNEFKIEITYAPDKFVMASYVLPTANDYKAHCIDSISRILIKKHFESIGQERDARLNTFLAVQAQIKRIVDENN